MTTIEKPNLIKTVFDEGILDYICFMLNSSKPDILLVSLEGLYRLLDYGRMYFLTEDGKNPVVQKILKSKTADRLEELQLNKSQKVFEVANNIIENFFDNENDN